MLTLAQAMALFFLEFGPRVMGIDLVALASVVAIAIYVVTNRTLPTVKSSLIVPVVLLGVLIVYSAALVIIRGGGDLFYPLRFGRALLNLAGCYCLAASYLQVGEERGLGAITKGVAATCSMHALFMLCQYVVPGIREATYAIVQFDDSQGLRVPGLTGSFGATSIVHTAGLLTCQILAARGGMLGSAAIVGVALNLWALTVLGRTGLMLGATALIVLWLRLGRKQMRLMVTTAVVAVSAIVVIASFDTEAALRYREGTLEHILEPLRAYQATGRAEAASISTLADSMLFLPDDDWVFLFGSGQSGRGDVYIPSDSGFVLGVFGVGLFGLTLMLAAFGTTIWAGLRLGARDRHLSFVLTVTAVMVLLYNVKEQTLLTRFCFTPVALLSSAGILLSSRTPVKAGNCAEGSSGVC